MASRSHLMWLQGPCTAVETILLSFLSLPPDSPPFRPQASEAFGVHTLQRRCSHDELSEPPRLRAAGRLFTSAFQALGLPRPGPVCVHE